MVAWPGWSPGGERSGRTLNSVLEAEQTGFTCRFSQAIWHGKQVLSEERNQTLERLSDFTMSHGG